ncbi:ABC-type branched-subunit amino acid transport system substrate-binding protein [Nitrobacteraceae bacterium AZCC 1564]
MKAIYADDGADRGQTVNIFQRLIRQDKVIAILGPTLSNSAFAADPIAQQAGIPVIASSNTAPNVTKIGDFIFRTRACRKIRCSRLCYATRGRSAASRRWL